MVLVIFGMLDESGSFNHADHSQILRTRCSINLKPILRGCSEQNLSKWAYYQQAIKQERLFDELQWPDEKWVKPGSGIKCYVVINFSKILSCALCAGSFLSFERYSPILTNTHHFAAANPVNPASQHFESPHVQRRRRWKAEDLQYRIYS